MFNAFKKLVAGVAISSALTNAAYADGLQQVDFARVRIEAAERLEKIFQGNLIQQVVDYYRPLEEKILKENGQAILLNVENQRNPEVLPVGTVLSRYLNSSVDVQEIHAYTNTDKGAEFFHSISLSLGGREASVILKILDTVPFFKINSRDKMVGEIDVSPAIHDYYFQFDSIEPNEKLGQFMMKRILEEVNLQVVFQEEELKGKLGHFVRVSLQGSDGIEAAKNLEESLYGFGQMVQNYSMQPFKIFKQPLDF